MPLSASASSEGWRAWLRPARWASIALSSVWAKIIGFHNDSAGRTLSVLQDVYKSESDINQRNQAIGALMLAYGYIKTNWQQAVDLYTRQCSTGVNAKDLATMAATLAAGGKIR
jgi:glutaminase